MREPNLSRLRNVKRALRWVFGRNMRVQKTALLFERNLSRATVFQQSKARHMSAGIQE